MTQLCTSVLLACALVGCLEDASGQDPTQVDPGPNVVGIDGAAPVLDLDGAPTGPREDAGMADTAVSVAFPDGSAANVSDASTVASDANAAPDAPGPDVREAGAPDAGSYQEVFAQGLTKYVGTPQVKETEVTTWDSDHPINVHHFSGDNRGPRCMYGDEYVVETREGSSDALMIFLQGGGVCLKEICAATPSTILSLQLFDLASLIGIGGILNPGDADNPMRDFDVVGAPYCDGSLFSGDVDRVLSDGNPDNGDQDLAYQRGLQNLTATLETAHRYFPHPSRVVLAGSSGGAYGVVTGVVLTRYFYPDAPLLILSDSGAPVVNGADKNFITRALTEIDALKLIPKSCRDCLANGHATGVFEWAMRFDPKLSFAYMTHAHDHVIGEYFMRTTADQFQAAVVSESDRLVQQFPGRAFRFVIPSAAHTLSMGIDGYSPEIQSLFLGLASGAIVSSGIGFTGDDVSADELATWSLGGMRETGTDAKGTAWSGYDWLRSLLEDPTDTPNILQLR